MGYEKFKVRNNKNLSMFTKPKKFLERPFYNNVKRVPRKFKKKYKHIFFGNRYDFLTIEQKLWFILSLENPEYHRFLISEVCNSHK